MDITVFPLKDLGLRSWGTGCLHNHGSFPRLPVPCSSGSQARSWGDTVMSHNTHVTLLTTLASPNCHPCHTPCTSSTQNSSALEALLSQLHMTPRFQNLVPHSNSVSPIPPSNKVSSLVQFQLLFLSVFQHSIPVFPSVHIAFLCSIVFQYVPVPNGYALDSYIYRPHLYYIWYVWISTLTIVLIVYSTSGPSTSIRHP